MGIESDVSSDGRGCREVMISGVLFTVIAIAVIGSCSYLVVEAPATYNNERKAAPGSYSANDKNYILLPVDKTPAQGYCENWYNLPVHNNFEELKKSLENAQSGEILLYQASDTASKYVYRKGGDGVITSWACREGP